MTTMPADFPVDGQGFIRVTQYRKNEGDHPPFEQIRDFAQQDA